MSEAVLIAGLVPAKLTSVRVPEKNLALLNGLPLLLHSVRAANKSDRIDRVYVSTESDKIAEVVRQENCALIERPSELSDPTKTNFHVLCHALQAMEGDLGRQPDLIVLLQPSHPFRRPDEIDAALDLIVATPEASSLVTVAPVGKAVGRVEDGRWRELTPLDRGAAGADQPLFRNEGNIYVFRPDETLAKDRYFGDCVIAHQLENPELDIDIDYPWDLEYANAVCAANPLAKQYLSPFPAPDTLAAAKNEHGDEPIAG